MNELEKRILNELMTYKGFRKHSQFAKFLDITPQLLNNWYQRGHFDLKILIQKFPEVSVDFLMNGTQPMLKKYVKVEPTPKEEEQDIPLENNQNADVEYSLFKELDQKNAHIDQLIRQQDKLIDENKEMRKQIGMLLEKLVNKLD